MHLIIGILPCFLATVSGFVKDFDTHKPLEYAVVILYDTTGKQIMGTSTDKDGFFVLKGINPGLYYLCADYIGYKKEKTELFMINKREFHVGVIYLKPEYLKVEEVVVEAKPEKVRREVDKLVIEPTGDVISGCTTARDLLKGVPGVRVDVSSKVEIKNSSNFTVLINGKPTMMDLLKYLKQFLQT